MKLKRLKDKTHTDEKPRWIWQLRWMDPHSGRELGERIGYYCRARDNWRPPSSRLPRLSEKEARAARSRKLKDLSEARAGIIIPASHATRRQWAEYCKRTGQPTGLALERMMKFLDSDAFRQLEETCTELGVDVSDKHKEIVFDLVERHRSDAPSSWEELTEWYHRDGSPGAGHRSMLEARTTFKRFAELCPELARRWQHITIDDAKVFKNHLSKMYSPMTVRKYLTYMRALWYACSRRWIQGNPWAELRFPRSGADAEAWHYYKPSEAAALLCVADQTWKARIRLAWKSGLRPGEIDHLRVTDIDWEESRVRIRRQWASECVLRWSPKDKDARSVPLDTETLALLRRLQAKAAPGDPYLFVPERRWRQAIALQSAGKWRPDAELVCGKRKRWLKIVDESGIKADDDNPLVFYSLRKTCCCDMLTGGVPTHEVQALMGHSNIKTTLTWYSKVNKEDAEKRIREVQGRAG